MLGLNGEVMLHAERGARKENENVRKATIRTRTIRDITFNLNSLPEMEILKDFRFRLPEIQRIPSELE